MERNETPFVVDPSTLNVKNLSDRRTILFRLDEVDVKKVHVEAGTRVADGVPYDAFDTIEAQWIGEVLYPGSGERTFRLNLTRGEVDSLLEGKDVHTSPQTELGRLMNACAAADVPAPLTTDLEGTVMVIRSDRNERFDRREIWLIGAVGTEAEYDRNTGEALVDEDMAAKSEVKEAAPAY